MAVGLSRAGAHRRSASGPLSCGDLSWMHRPQTACLNFLQHSQGIQIWSGWGRRARLRSPAVAARRSPTQRALAGRAGSGGLVWHQYCGFPVPALRGGRVQWEGGVRGHFQQFRGALLRDPPRLRGRLGAWCTQVHQREGEAPGRGAWGGAQGRGGDAWGRAGAQRRREAWAWTGGCGRGGRPRSSRSCRETRTPSDGGKEAPRPQSEVSSCGERRGLLGLRAGAGAGAGCQVYRPSSPSRCSRSICVGLSGTAAAAPAHIAPGRPLGMGGESRSGGGRGGGRGRGAGRAARGGGRIQCVSFCSSRPASHWLHSGFSATTKRRLVLVSLCAWNSLGAAQRGGRWGSPRPQPGPRPPPHGPARCGRSNAAPVATPRPLPAATLPPLAPAPRPCGRLRSALPSAPGAVATVDDGVVRVVHRAEEVLGLFHNAAALARLGAPLGLRRVCEGPERLAPPLHLGTEAGLSCAQRRPRPPRRLGEEALDPSKPHLPAWNQLW